MLFDTWSQLARTAASGVAAYVVLLVVLRVSGKRTLAKLNAFDFIVTVALGSALATILLSADVSVAEGAVALVVLVGSQYLVATATVRVTKVSSIVKSAPVLLVDHGRLLHEPMRRSRVNAEEVRQAVRASGKGGLELVAAVILETDGSLSVITKADEGSGNTLVDVGNPPR